MKIAIIHNDGKVIVSFPEDKFKDLLKKYYKGDMDKAFAKITTDLKKELLKI
jgi:hypothetical protein